VEATIEVHEAIRSATKTLQALYEGRELHNLLLEEVEMAEDESEWIVTLGFDAPDSSAPSILPSMKRHYKLFHINAESGKVKSMKIRTI